MLLNFAGELTNFTFETRWFEMLLSKKPLQVQECSLWFNQIGIPEGLRFFFLSYCRSRDKHNIIKGQMRVQPFIFIDLFKFLLYGKCKLRKWDNLDSSWAIVCSIDTLKHLDTLSIFLFWRLLMDNLLVIFKILKAEMIFF